MPRARTGSALRTPDGRWQPVATVGRHRLRLHPVASKSAALRRAKVAGDELEAHRATVDTGDNRRMLPIVLLADGSPYRLDPLPDKTTKAKATELARAWAQRALREGIVATPKPKKPAAIVEGKMTDADRWVAMWLEDRAARGLTTVRDNASVWRIHARAVLGGHHPRDWTPDLLRELVRRLDAGVAAGDMSWKTALNVWTAVRAMCSDAAGSKVEALRCRADNPAATVRAPDRGAHKEKAFLYPSEVGQLLACEEVPMLWRRIVAIAVYTYLRAGELRVLRWEDVDLEHGVILVHRAYDRRNGGEKTTKGKRARRVPIEPTLAPLLREMHQESQGRGLVLSDMPSHRTMAKGLRRRLKRAGVDRVELHDATPTRKAITFHDLRATGLTWLAVAGLDAFKIQRRAGHADIATTDDYVRLAESLGNGFGEPFAELPGSMFRTRIVQGNDQALGQEKSPVISGLSGGVDGTRIGRATALPNVSPEIRGAKAPRHRHDACGNVRTVVALDDSGRNRRRRPRRLCRRSVAWSRRPSQRRSRARQRPGGGTWWRSSRTSCKRADGHVRAPRTMTGRWSRSLPVAVGRADGDGYSVDRTPPGRDYRHLELAHRH